jgi:SAM-dependent methyltransferase
MQRPTSERSVLSGSSLKAFFAPHADRLAADPAFGGAINPSSELARDGRRHQLAMMIDEAAETVDMIAPRLAHNPRLRVLEVGGGVALAYAYLRAAGVDLVAIEPGEAGYAGRYQTGCRLLELMAVDAAGWSPLGAGALTTLGKSFDLIVSNFVLEHIDDLAAAMRAMGDVLAPGGVMVHRCPNYHVPYEPHFCIPLVPFAPRATAALVPRLRDDGLWRGLNFVTSSDVQRVCRAAGLTPTFLTGRYFWAFDRLRASAEFASRKRFFARIARILGRLGLLPLLKLVPTALTTPMEFSAVKAPSATP